MACSCKCCCGCCCDGETGEQKLERQCTSPKEFQGKGTSCDVCCDLGEIREDIDSEEDCPGTWVVNGRCVDNPCASDSECETNGDCPEGQYCCDGLCEEGPIFYLPPDCGPGECLCQSGTADGEFPYDVNDKASCDAWIAVNPNPPCGECTTSEDCLEGEVCCDGECVEERVPFVGNDSMDASPTIFDVCDTSGMFPTNCPCPEGYEWEPFNPYCTPECENPLP
jgi:hypothetical protein